MLVWAFLFSAASALEAVVTIASPTSSSVSSSSSSGPVPTTQPPTSVTLASSLTTTAPTIPYSECNPDDARVCSRLPEQPYYNVGPGYTAGGLFFVNMAVGLQEYWPNPWYYMEESATGDASISASTCGAGYSSQLTSYFMSAPVTSAFMIPGTSTVFPLTPYTSTQIYQSSIGVTTVALTTVYLTYGELPGASSQPGDGATYATTTYTSLVEVIYTEITSTTTQTSTEGSLIWGPAIGWQYANQFTFTPTPPCCSACTLYGGNIEVYFWPSATATPSSQPPYAVNGTFVVSPAVSTTVNAAGFTFTSPSIYLAIETMAAADLCSEVGSSVTSGTTLPFPTDVLSTAPAYSWDKAAYPSFSGYPVNTFTEATWGALPCTNIVRNFYDNGGWPGWSGSLSPTSSTNYVSSTVVTYFTTLSVYTVTYNPCSPYVSMPTAVYSLNPSWAVCSTAAHFVLFDPPYPLTTGNVLLAPTTPAILPVLDIDSTTSSLVTPSATLPTQTSEEVPPTTLVTFKDTLVQPMTSTDLPVQTTSTDPPSQTTPDLKTKSDPPLPTQITVDGTSYSFQAGGSSVVVDGTTTKALNSISVIISGTTQPLIALLTSSAPTPEYIVASQTLIPGGSAITVSGTVVSLQAQGSSVVVGTKTEALSAFLGSKTTTVAGGLGGMIVSIGGFTTAGSSSSSSSFTQYTTGARPFNGTVFIGQAGKSDRGVWMAGLGMGILVVIVAWM